MARNVDMNKVSKVETPYGNGYYHDGKLYSEDDWHKYLSDGGNIGQQYHSPSGDARIINVGGGSGAGAGAIGKKSFFDGGTPMLKKGGSPQLKPGDTGYVNPNKPKPNYSLLNSMSTNQTVNQAPNEESTEPVDNAAEENQERPIANSNATPNDWQENIGVNSKKYLEQNVYDNKYAAKNGQAYKYSSETLTPEQKRDEFANSDYAKILMGGNTTPPANATALNTSAKANSDSNDVIESPPAGAKIFQPNDKGTQLTGNNGQPQGQPTQKTSAPAKKSAPTTAQPKVSAPGGSGLGTTDAFSISTPSPRYQGIGTQEPGMTVNGFTDPMERWNANVNPNTSADTHVKGYGELNKNNQLYNKWTGDHFVVIDVNGNVIRKSSDNDIKSYPKTQTSNH